MTFYYKGWLEDRERNRQLLAEIKRQADAMPPEELQAALARHREAKAERDAAGPSRTKERGRSAKPGKEVNELPGDSHSELS